MPAMTDWSRSTPLSCSRPCSARIAASTSGVNASSSGSGPSRAMPGTSAGSRTTYTASFLRVPASVRSKPGAVVEVDAQRERALAVRLGRRRRQRGPPLQPAGPGQVDHQVQAVHVQVEELPVPARPGHGQPAERGHRRVVRLQGADRGDVDPGHHAPDGALAQHVGEGLHLRQLGHRVQSAAAVGLPRATVGDTGSRYGDYGRRAPEPRPRAGDRARRRRRRRGGGDPGPRPQAPAGRGLLRRQLAGQPDHRPGGRLRRRDPGGPARRGARALPGGPRARPGHRGRDCGPALDRGVAVAGGGAPAERGPGRERRRGRPAGHRQHAAIHPAADRRLPGSASGSRR